MLKNNGAFGANRPKKNAEIRSTFLRLLIRYYGILSIQLTPLRWNPRSVITFVWNLSISMLYTYLYLAAIKFHATNRQNDAMEAMIAKKPLFGILIKIGSLFIYLITYIVVTIYFIVISNIFGNGTRKRSNDCELVTLLDSIRVSRFDSIRSGRRLFVGMLVVHQVLYVITVATLIIKSLFGRSPITELRHLPAWASTATTYLLFFTLSAHTSIPFILSHYYKYATLCALRAQHTKLIIAETGIFRNVENRKFRNSDRDRDEALREFENEIYRLAMINRRLDAILSIPLLIAIASFIIDITIVLASFWIDGARFPDNAYILQFLLHLTIIASLERRIQRQLRSIRWFLESRQSGPETRISNSIAENVSSQNSINSNNWMFRSRIFDMQGLRNDANRYEIESMESVAIRRREVMNLYEKYFRLRLLSVTYVDWSFLFNMTLFVINYVVLVAQTTI